VTLRLHLENAAAQEQKVELTARIKPEGFSGTTIEVRTNVVLAANSRTEIILKPDTHPELIMKKPRLWWPVTYGDQPLYRLSVEARVDGRVSDSAGRLFGVRKVGSLIPPGGGAAFTVNGRILRLTGGAWIPDFLVGWDAQRYRDEIRLMAEGNHTVVRVNGCGIVPPDVFFDECDRLGVMVWEDLMRTSIESHTATISVNGALLRNAMSRSSGWRICATVCCACVDVPACWCGADRTSSARRRISVCRCRIRFCPNLTAHVPGYRVLISTLTGQRIRFGFGAAVHGI
jgi:hypothetical protein